jgi:hypothetical protein
MTAQFVPWSQSLNKAEKHPSLNWIVTIYRTGLRPHAILTTDYCAGSAHAPSYKPTFGRRTLEDQERDRRVEWECEHGHSSIGVAYEGTAVRVYGGNNPAKALAPNMRDVFASLATDSSVLDESSFEDWASSLGYETDSRKAEAIYRAYLDIALKLRNALGENGLTQLRDACQDY